MGDELLTQKELAERWKVDVSSITKWRREGVLQQVEKLPVIRFKKSYVEELEGIKLERTSPLVVKRLQSENERLESENKRLKGIITNVLQEVAPILKEV